MYSVICSIETRQMKVSVLKFGSKVSRRLNCGVGRGCSGSRAFVRPCVAAAKGGAGGAREGGGGVGTIMATFRSAAPGAKGAKAVLAAAAPRPAVSPTARAASSKLYEDEDGFCTLCTLERQETVLHCRNQSWSAIKTTSKLESSTLSPASRNLKASKSLLLAALVTRDFGKHGTKMKCSQASFDRHMAGGCWCSRAL